MLKIITFTHILFFLTISVTFGEMVSLELNVSAAPSDVEGKLEFKIPVDKVDIIPGMGVLYSADKYMISNLNLSIRNQIYLPALSLGIGFKGTIGTEDQYITKDEMGALGFLFIGEYDFRKNPAKTPVSLVITATGAPSPLCFADTENYYDFSLTSYLHVIKHASVLIGYRHFNFELRNNQKIADNSIAIGCKLHF